MFYRKIAKPTDEISSLIDKLSGNFYLATVHRAENTDDPVRFNNIMDALNTISGTTPVVLPLHPRTRKLLGSDYRSQVQLIEPVGYFDMITLLSHCQAVFTDSGGLQKEAFFFHKPCVTLRDETEWVELVAGGFNTIVGANREKITNSAETIRNLASFKDSKYSCNLYGNGKAAEKILKAMVENL